MQNITAQGEQNSNPILFLPKQALITLPKEYAYCCVVRSKQEERIEVKTNQFNHNIIKGCGLLGPKDKTYLFSIPKDAIANSVHFDESPLHSFTCKSSPGALSALKFIDRQLTSRQISEIISLIKQDEEPIVGKWHSEWHQDELAAIIGDLSLLPSDT